MDTQNFQRIGSISNAHVGRDFEFVAKGYFQKQGMMLEANYSVSLGAWKEKKKRQFDLGSLEPPVLVECKSHRWTSSDNIPSAKITVWNESMYYFHLAPPEYRKVLFVLCDYSKKRGLSLAEYYKRNYSHLIPVDVEIFEYDEKMGIVRKI